MNSSRRRSAVLVLGIVLSAGMTSLAYAPDPASATGTVLYVATTGHDSGNCQAQISPCATISYAITQAPSGATIDVGAGTFNEHVSISSGTTLTIQGAGQASTFIDGGGTGTGVSVPSTANVTLSGLTVQHGAASDGGGIESFGALSLDDVTVSNNSSQYEGAGILAEGTATLNNVIVSGNTITNTPSGFDAEGAGLFVFYATVTVTDSTITDNSAENGIDSEGVGGGIEVNVGTLTMTDSTISENQAAWGAGVLNQGTATMTNDTLSGNTAVQQGGCCLTNPTSGGGFYNDGTATLRNDTVSGNSATYGGGLLGNDGTVTLTAVLVANSVPGGDCAGFITDLGYNIDDDGTCGFTTPSTSDSATLDGTLGPLANNGGPTETIALLPGSPAIGQVLGADCPATDQRGDPRGNPCDIGAYDTDTGRLMNQTITFTSTPPANGIVRGPYTVTATGGDSGNPVTYSSATASECTVSGSTVTFVGVGTCTIDANQAGNARYLAAPTAMQSFPVIRGITSADSAPATVGSSFSFSVTTVGSPVPSLKEKGKLPKDLKFHSNGNGTATLSGTPTSTKKKSAVGTYTLTFTAAFGKGKSNEVTQNFTLTIIS